MLPDTPARGPRGATTALATTLTSTPRTPSPVWWPENAGRARINPAGNPELDDPLTAARVLALHADGVVARTTKKYVPANVEPPMPSVVPACVDVTSRMPQQSFVPLAKAANTRTVPPPLTAVLTAWGPVEEPPLT